jgi:hypothetical protein
MGGRAESGFGYSGHRDGELGGRVRAQAGPAIWAGIGVATGHQQAQRCQNRPLASLPCMRLPDSTTS